jgi:hypothetical protein
MQYVKRIENVHLLISTCSGLPEQDGHFGLHISHKQFTKSNLVESADNENSHKIYQVAQ